MKGIVMKTVSWIAGILGIVVALIGVVGGLRGGVVTIERGHAPAVFLIVGTLLLVIGIWLALLGLQEKK
jgi:hypothetical protein